MHADSYRLLSILGIPPELHGLTGPRQGRTAFPVFIARREALAAARTGYTCPAPACTGLNARILSREVLLQDSSNDCMHEAHSAVPRKVRVRPHMHELPCS